ncbi:hypothetical protein DSM106972_032070 [Dulcicalothrix desertica PCC 7102]|uniref:Transposase IS204/IS1001/IS1096/IS1165 DDE domain-containing protein n=1 Tax=Dulcicalothrix desertica PCC 7102 TaxID=232991 RepID=A0A433VIR2_9CYAN|nr:hypothetical protein DSM106972_032070 [Dulcicalothrix desertica PCC 7102]
MSTSNSISITKCAKNLLFFVKPFRVQVDTQRAESLGGKLKLISQSEEGCRVTVYFLAGYFDKKTTNGVVEGINNKLKLIKRSEFGFTNFRNF